MPSRPRQEIRRCGARRGSGPGRLRYNIFGSCALLERAAAVRSGGGDFRAGPAGPREVTQDLNRWRGHRDRSVAWARVGPPGLPAPLLRDPCRWPTGSRRLSLEVGVDRHPDETRKLLAVEHAGQLQWEPTHDAG